MLSSRVVRRVVQRRNFSVFDNKNTIGEVRSKFYSNPAVGAENPTYLKESGDKLKVAVAMVGVATGVTVILNGLWNMSWGINKVEKK